MKKEITHPPLRPSHGMAQEDEVRSKPLARACERLRLMMLDKISRMDRSYFPFAQFEDCRVGTAKQRDAAFLANKQRKGLILPYVAAWSLRGLAMGVGMATAANLEAAGAQTTLIQAAFAMGMCACIVICAVLWVGWLGLTCFKE